ncbi:MAG: Gfo/Idh/MocA family oxidoreductase [Anaerolineae bacterium]|nr:Gfo/Idh/MocA family oxidoreductase [Anaerolineae bacterium]
MTKLILVGIGSFGERWYETIRARHPDWQLIVVDTDPVRATRIVDSGDNFYTSLMDAIEIEKPDFIINATPPRAHTEINELAFDYGLPVLCEKPIAESYTEAIQVVTRAINENIPFMVAENYRRIIFLRKTKKLLEAGMIGQVRTLHCEVYRNFYTDKPYFRHMEHPFLVDVAIHHLDLIRYLSGSEGRQIFAKSFKPWRSWHSGNMALYLLLEMQNGAIASLTGSLVTEGLQTSWWGNWRIEGTQGAITLIDDKINVITREYSIPVDSFDDVSADDRLELVDDFGLSDCLQDFTRLLKKGPRGESDGLDYLKTQTLVYFAEKSSMLNQVVEIKL